MTDPTSGADHVFDGTPDPDTRYGTNDNDDIYGAGGDDILNGGAYYDRLDGGDGNDTLISGFLSPDWYAGASVPDYIPPFDYTKARTETLIGGRGDDRYEIMTGSELVVELAGEGNDTVATYASYALPPEAEIETLRAYYPDSIYAINLTGNAFANAIMGNSGDNILDGRGGADRMVGYAGNDTYGVDSAGDVVVELTNQGNDTIRTSVSLALADAQSIENLFAADAASTAAIDLSGNSGDNIVGGNEGANRLEGRGGDDLLAGYGGRDILYSGTGTDSLFGGDGDDGLVFGSGFASGDIANGGAGTDTLVLQGAYAATSLAGISAVEVLLLASAGDTRFGGSGAGSYSYELSSVDANLAAGGTLTISASDLKNGETLAFDGSAETNGNFRFFAGRGVDDLTGGAGNDGFFFGAADNLTAADRIVGGAGTDSIALRGNYTGANAVAFQAASFTGVEVLTFLSGHTNEFGGPIAATGFDYDVTIADGNVAAGGLLQVIGVNLGADESLRFDGRAESDGSLRILSGSGDDALWGGAGNDTLYGALGADQMDGGAGADTYLFRTAQDSTASSRDTIAFGTGDRIDLALIDAIAGTPANDGFSFVGAAAFSSTAGELRAYQSGAQWFVEGDVNGDGTADFALALTSAAPIVASDFIL